MLVVPLVVVPEVVFLSLVVDVDTLSVVDVEFLSLLDEVDTLPVVAEEFLSPVVEVDTLEPEFDVEVREFVLISTPPLREGPLTVEVLVRPPVREATDVS